MRFGRNSMLICTVGLYTVLRICVPFLGSTGIDRKLIHILALVNIPLFMLAQLAIIPGITRFQPRFRAAGIMLLVGVACIAAITLTAKSAIPLPKHTLIIFRDFALVLSAVSLGCIVSFIFREPNILLPVGIIAGLVDLWNVTVGPLGHIVEKHPDIIDKVSVHVPTPAPDIIPMVTIGMGDVVFLAMFFAVLYRFSMNVNAAFWLGYILLTLSLFFAFDISIPALVPMGVAILITNYKYFNLNREEKFATIYVSGFVAALLAAHAYYVLIR